MPRKPEDKKRKKEKAKDEKKSLKSIADLKPKQKPKRGRERVVTAPKETATVQPAVVDFPIVGMGASAGGLEAFERFFLHMPSDKGVAFVLVVHLDPSHESMMVDLLRRFTEMKVVQAGDGSIVERDHVYVIPPNKDMALFQGRLHLSPPQAIRGQRMPIDFFLRSLSEDRGDRAIGIILSGTGTDGTLGLRAIHGAGGMSIVQDPSTARYDGMPRSAIAAGLADYVLPPENMGEQLLSYVQRVDVLKPQVSTALAVPLMAIQKILAMLRTKTGHDFSLYKKNTIRRRIERRMSLHNLESLSDYVAYLQGHPGEVNQLFKEVLINVTSFFREPDAFEVLKKEIFPKMVLDRDEDYVSRVWIVGCATGEEAYSIAIAFREYGEEARKEYKLQIFATDIDEDSINTARAGLYPANIAMDVSAERLKRFFIKEETGFRIRKDIRESVVFAVQNVIKDAPFTRLDIISCRNLMIYMEPELQNRVLPLFHYALRPGGFLFLGSAESIGGFADLFAAVEKKWKFYRAKPSIGAGHAVMPGMFWDYTAGPKAAAPGEEKKPEEVDIEELANDELLRLFAPPSVIVNESGEMLYVYGDTGLYLRLASGQPKLNILKMAKEDIRTELRSAIQTAITHGKRVVLNHIPLRQNGGAVNLTVKPLTEKMAGQGLLMVIFEQVHAPKEEKEEKKKQGKAGQEDSRYVSLERELRYTRENLQATVEELQASNEELKSTNEELQSTNEELQSTNEEMETSKEELQSVNEELVTVNSELQSKIDQLSRAENDMKNLMDNTNVGTIFLDNDMRIKRFTQAATRVVNLIATDAGRHLADIVTRFEDLDLANHAKEVFLTLQFRELEAQTKDKEWYLVRMMPYRTAENIIDGVVITCTDITLLKEAARERTQRIIAEGLALTIKQPLVVLDANWRVLSANGTFYKTFDTSRQDTEGHDFYDLFLRRWDNPQLKNLLDDVLAKGAFFEDFRFDYRNQKGGTQTMFISGRRLAPEEYLPKTVLIALDVADEARA